MELAHRGDAERRARGARRRQAEGRRRAVGRRRESRQSVRSVPPQLLVSRRRRGVLPEAAAASGGAPQMSLGSMRAIGAALALVVTTAIAEGGQAAAARPKMVEDVFKNVQALTGIGVDDFL